MFAQRLTRSTRHICPFCEARTIFQHGSQPTRTLTQLRKKQPSRMELSRSVAKSKPITPLNQPSKPRTDPRNGPWAGMNRTDAGVRVKAEQLRRETRATSVKARKNERSSRTSGRSHEPRPMKALKMQGALHQVPYGTRSEVKSRLEDIDSFSTFPLLPAVQEAIEADALRGLIDISPTPIQRLAIPAMLGTHNKYGRAVDQAEKVKGMQQFLLAAETGSGKTLAYSIPVLDAIKRVDVAEREAERLEKELQDRSKKQNMFELEPPPLSNEVHPSTARPKAIVLVPTAELVEQVGGILKTFSHKVKLRVSMISAAYSATIIRSRLFKQPVDVIVSTPHLLGSIADSEPNILSEVSHLVIDEADSLFDRGFAPLTSAIIDRSTPSLKQLVLCSATIPRSLDNYLRKRFPEIQRLTTPNLHAIPRRVQLSVVDIDKDPYRGNRDLACADTLWTIGRAPAADDEVKRIVVFVNERAEAQRVAEYLVSKGIDAAALNRDTAEQRSGEILEAFKSSGPGVTVSKDEMISTNMTAKRVLPKTKVIVMTDIGSRGIDTTAVRHVVLYDVPHTSIDFIHRLGRTGRMGRRGKGIVLAGKQDRKDVIADVRESMYRGQALI